MQQRQKVNPLIKPMKTLKYLLLLCSLLPIAAFAQVNAIRKAVTAINSDTGYQQVRLDNESYLEEMTDRGGSLTGLYKKNQLKKMTSWIGYSNKIVVTEYYLQNGKLIFVYEVEKTFPYDEKKQQLDEAHPVNSYEGRYYYQNGKKIEEKVTGQKPQGTAEDWTLMAKDLQQLVDSQKSVQESEKN